MEDKKSIVVVTEYGSSKLKKEAGEWLFLSVKNIFKFGRRITLKKDNVNWEMSESQYLSYCKEGYFK